MYKFLCFIHEWFFVILASILVNVISSCFYSCVLFFSLVILTILCYLLFYYMILKIRKYYLHSHYYHNDMSSHLLRLGFQEHMFIHREKLLKTCKIANASKSLLSLMGPRGYRRLFTSV